MVGKQPPSKDPETSSSSELNLNERRAPPDGSSGKEGSEYLADVSSTSIHRTARQKPKIKRRHDHTDVSSYSSGEILRHNRPVANRHSRSWFPDMPSDDSTESEVLPPRPPDRLRGNEPEDLLQQLRRMDGSQSQTERPDSLIHPQASQQGSSVKQIPQDSAVKIKTHGSAVGQYSGTLKQQSSSVKPYDSSGKQVSSSIKPRCSSVQPERLQVTPSPDYFRPERSEREKFFSSPSGGQETIMHPTRPLRSISVPPESGHFSVEPVDGRYLSNAVDVYVDAINKEIEDVFGQDISAAVSSSTR